jgi:hypothetical protein
VSWPDYYSFHSVFHTYSHTCYYSYYTNHIIPHNHFGSGSLNINGPYVNYIDLLLHVKSDLILLECVGSGSSGYCCCYSGLLLNHLNQLCGSNCNYSCICLSLMWFSIVLIMFNMLQIPVLFVFNLVRNFIMPNSIV